MNVPWPKLDNLLQIMLCMAKDVIEMCRLLFIEQICCLD